MALKQIDPGIQIATLAPGVGRTTVPHIVTFSGITSTLAKVYRQPDEALRQSVHNAAMMRRDPMIMGPLLARQQAVALLPWSIVPEDEKNSELRQVASSLEDIVRRTPRLTEYFRNLMEAIWYGKQAAQHGWGKTRDRSGKAIRYIQRWVPLLGDKLVFRFDDGKAEFDPDQIGIKVTPAWARSNVVLGEPDLEYTSEGSAVFLNRWQRTRIAVHKHLVMDGDYIEPWSAGMIHGVGLRHFLYWCWFQKQETLAQLSEVVERTGMGFTIYYYPAGNERAQAEVREIAEQQPNKNQIIMPFDPSNPDAYRVEQIPPNTGGITALSHLIDDYFGNWIIRFILGQTLSMRADATGMGSGLSDLQKDSFLQIVRYDATNLEETLTTDLVQPLLLFNFPKYRNTRFFLKIATESSVPAEKLQALNMAWSMGAKIRTQDILDMVGAATPGDDDDTVWNPGVVGAMMQIQQEQAKAAPPQQQGGGGGLEEAYAALLGGAPVQQSKRYGKGWDPEVAKLPQLVSERKHPGIRVVRDEQGWHATDPESGVAAYVNDDESIRYTHGDPLDIAEDFERLAKEAVKQAQIQQEMSVWKELDPERYAEAARGLLPKSVPSGQTIKSSGDIFNELKDLHGETDNHDEAAWILPSGEMISNGGSKSPEEQSWRHHDVVSLFEEHSPDILKDKKKRSASAIRAMQRFGAAPVLQHDDGTFHLEIRNDLSSSQLDRIRNVVQSGRPVSVSIIADTFDSKGKSRGEDEVYHGQASSLEEVEDLADAIRRRTVEKGDPAGDEILSKLKGSKHSAVSILESGRVLVPSRSGKARPNMRDAYLYTMDFSGASKNKLDKDTKGNNKKIAEALHDEALMALRHSSDAIGWYSRTFRKAAQAYETAFPEIKTDAGKRAVFMALLAVTSNGVSVPVNNNLAARIFRDYIQNEGKINPDDYVYPGKSSDAIKGHVRLINELLHEKGEQGLAQFLGQQMKAGDVWKNAFQDQIGLKKGAAGEHVDEDVRGSNVFGPKLGSFYNNLNQNFDSVTMDRWFTRTIRRIMGTLADPNKDAMPGQIERILRSFGVKGSVSGQIEDIDDDDDEDDDAPRRTRKINLDKIAADPNLAGSDEYRSARTKTVKRDGVSIQVPAFHLKTKDIVRDLIKMQQTGRLAKNSAGMQFILDREFWRAKTDHKDKSEISQASHRLHENLYGLNDAPGSASERRRIRGIMQQTQEMLGKSGYQMDMADLQALLWYSEKRLMPHLGIVNSRQLPDDYARQAQLWVDQFLRGDFDDDSAAQPRDSRGSGSRIGAAGPRPKPSRVAGGSGSSKTAAALFAAAPDRNDKGSSPSRYALPLAAIPVAAAAAPAAATAGTTAAAAGTTAATAGMTAGQAANIAANVAPMAIGIGKGLTGLAAGPEGSSSSKYEQAPDSFGVGTEATGAPMFSYDTPQRYSSEDSDEFKAWFGGSVVHDNGKPLVVYHGTPDARGLLSDGFKISRHEGAFFATPDYRVADSYADDHRAADYQTAEPHVIPLYLRIENPLVIDNKGKRWSGTSDHIKKAKEAGHDGIVIKNTFDAYHVDKDRHGRKIKDPHDVYVWFDPNQAKSAMSAPLKSRVDQKEIGGGPNRGSWSTEDSRLTYAKDYDASLWNHESIGEQQQHQSKLTSLSQVPSTLKAVEATHGWQEGTVNADIGGGRFDHFTNELGRRGVTNYIYDPFNRSNEHNHRVASAVANGRAHTATVNNVLNVIKEPEIRDHVIRQAANAIKDDGKAYFLMHEGTAADREKGARVTKSREGVTSWQEFRKAHTYIPEIEKHFGSVSRIPGTNVLVATSPVRSEGRPQLYSEPVEGNVNASMGDDPPAEEPRLDVEPAELPEPEPVEATEPEPVESEAKMPRKKGVSNPQQSGVERLKEKPTAAMRKWIAKQLPEGANRKAVNTLWRAYLDQHNAAIDEYDLYNMAAGSLSTGMEPHHVAAITKILNQGGDADTVSKKMKSALGKMGVDVMGQSLKDNYPYVLLPGDELGEQTALMLLTKKHPKQTPPSKKDKKLLEAAKASLSDSFWDEVHAEWWKPPRVTDEEREVLASHVRGKDGGKPEDQDIDRVAGQVEEQRQQGNAPGIVVNKPNLAPEDFDIDALESEPITPEEEQTIAEDPENQPPPKSEETERQKWIRQTIGSEVPEPMMQKVMDEYEAEHSRTTGIHKSHVEAANAVKDLLSPEGRESSFDAIRKDMQAGMNKDELLKKYDAPLRRAVALVRRHYPETAGSDPVQSTLEMIAGSHARLKQPKDMDEAILSRSMEVLPKELRDNQPVDPEKLDSWVRESLGAGATDERVDEVKSQYNAILKSVRSRSNAYHGLSKEYRDLAAKAGHPDMADFLKKEAMKGMPLDESRDLLNEHVPDLVERFSRFHPQVAGKDPAGNLALLLAGTHPQQLKLEAMSDWVLKQAIKDSASPEQEEAEEIPVDDAPYSDDQRKREELTASRLEGATANGNAILGKWKQIQIRDAKEIDRQVKAFEQRAKQLGIDANLGDISDDMRWWQKSDGTIGTLFDVKHDLDTSGGFHAAVDKSYASAVDSYREASDLAKSFGYEPDMRNLNKAVMGELNEAVLDAASRLGMDMLSFSPDEQVPKAFEYLKGQKEYLSRILEEADRLGYIDPGVPGKQVDLLEQIENASNWIIGEAHNAGFKPNRQMIAQGKSAMLEAALDHLSTKKAADEASSNKGVQGFIKRLGGPQKVLAGLALMATILMILSSLERSTRRR